MDAPYAREKDLPVPLVDPGPSAAAPSGPLISAEAALQQVLSTVNDIRDQFVDFRRDLADMRQRLAEAATKDDLKQFHTRDTLDARENAGNERMNALSARQARTEDKLDDLRDKWHDRELVEKDRDFDRRVQDDKETAEEHKGILLRGSDRLWAIFLFFGSPILYGLVNLIFTHPWAK